MKRLRNHLVGVDQGDVVLFSDFEDGGEMWTGRGQRERRRRIRFAQEYKSIPAVHVSLGMWDIDSQTPARVDLSAEVITTDGFDLVFRTWGDTKIARVRATWMSLGDLAHEDDWELY
jgi:hypothetical protein